jgi:hypothetical protein
MNTNLSSQKAKDNPMAFVSWGFLLPNFWNGGQNANGLSA